MKKKIFVKLIALFAAGLIALPASAETIMRKDASAVSSAVTLQERAGQRKDSYWGRITPQGKVYRLKQQAERDAASDSIGYEENKTLPLIKKADVAELWLYDYTIADPEYPYPNEYRIDNPAERDAIYQALVDLNAVCTFSGYSISDPDLCTGIDRTQYTPALTIELRRVDGSPGSIVSLLDGSAVLYTNGKTGDYNDAFFRGEKIPELFQLLNQSLDTRNFVSPTQMFDLKGNEVQHIYYDNKKIYTDVGECSEKIQAVFREALGNLDPVRAVAADLGKKRSGISSMSFYGAGNALTRFAFYQHGGPLVSRLEEYGLVPAEYYTFGNGQYEALLNAVNQAFQSAPKHPYWFGKLMVRDFIPVLESDSFTGAQHVPGLSANEEKNRWTQVRDILKQIEVDGYQSVGKGTELPNNALTIELVDSMDYLVSLSKRQIQITSDSLDYAVRYQLKNGGDILPLLQAALEDGAFHKQVSAYETIIDMVVKEDPALVSDIQELIVSSQDLTGLTLWGRKELQARLAQRYGVPVRYATPETLRADGTMTDAGLAHASLITIQDSWDGTEHLDFSITLYRSPLGAFGYDSWSLEYQNGEWVVTKQGEKFIS